MPSPLAHGLAGLCVHAAASRAPFELWNARRAALTIGAALLPDLDLALRLVDGRNHHQGISHSVGTALAAAIVAALIAWRRQTPNAGRLALAIGVAWLSHVGLDYLSVDTHPPIGLLALWPFSNAWHKSPWPLFLDIGRTLEWATVVHNAGAAAWELVVMLPITAMIWRARQRAGG